MNFFWSFIYMNLYSRAHLEGRICIPKIAAYPDGAVVQIARLKCGKQIQMQAGHVSSTPFSKCFTFCILLALLITHRALQATKEDANRILHRELSLALFTHTIMRESYMNFWVNLHVSGTSHFSMLFDAKSSLCCGI
jgi:hypothetical protein